MNITFKLDSLDGQTYKLRILQIGLAPPEQGTSSVTEASKAQFFQAPARFVTVELASTVTGLSPSAIRTKICRGVWLEGRQYVKREGRVFIDLKGYERWVECGT